MFSTVESEESRFVRCFRAEAEGIANGNTQKAAPVVIPRYLAREELRVRVAPTPERLARLAALLAESEQTPVVVEVWQTRFDSQSGKLLAQKRDEMRGTP